jgi:hypothetical protein
LNGSEEVPSTSFPEGGESESTLVLASEMGAAGTTGSANVKGTRDVMVEQESDDVGVVTDTGTAGSAEVKEDGYVVVSVILAEREDDDVVEVADGRASPAAEVANAKGGPYAELKPVPKSGAM